MTARVARVLTTGDIGNGVALGDASDTQHSLAGPLLPSSSCPRTPTTPQMKQDWHGLLSPQTPSYEKTTNTECAKSRGADPVHNQGENEISDVWNLELTRHKARPSHSPITPQYNPTPVLKDDIDLLNHDQLTLSTSVEGDAELAVQLSPSTLTRRSTRLRDKKEARAVSSVKTDRIGVTERSKVKATVKKSLITVPSPAAHEPALVMLTQAEPTKSPFSVAITSSAELPVLHSTEWQLMYPPGGSTHPSYPWPVPDPRLTFQTHYVPLHNGLPDVSFVPTLVLPAGWRHVSWAGLHPIVFDASQQGFKLTPVGPLPLTCEEIHQGGLQDYVPGGRFHPEHGLLPIMSWLSDGSDAEVYNFEGVDWKLPWTQIEGIEADGVEATPSALTAPVLRNISIFDERRDCPDDVTDLQDAWRWLKEWDPNSPTSFAASPGKTWFGSGVPMTTRTTKQPIASLMALTMTHKTPGVKEWLVKQVRREFCPFKSLATPAHVDITLLQDVEFTIVELLSYFPFHYQWGGGAHRLVRCGMGSSEIANLINMFRCLPAGSLCIPSTVTRYTRWDTSKEGSRVRIETPPTLATYTAEHWSNAIWPDKSDYPLLGLAAGLKELPSGVDAGPVTWLIRWCRDNGRHDAMLSDVLTLLKEAGISTLIEPGNGADADQEVLSRHIGDMKNDRLRVLREIRSMKGQGQQKDTGLEVEVTRAAREKNSRKRK